METSSFVGLGLPGAMLFILFFIVKYFVQALSKKDEQMARKDEQIIKLITDSNTHVNKLTSDFNKTVDNHIAQEIKHHEQNTMVMTRMLDTMQKMPQTIVDGLLKVMPQRQNIQVVNNTTAPEYEKING